MKPLDKLTKPIIREKILPNRYGPTDHICNKKVFLGRYHQRQHNKDGQIYCKCSIVFPDQVQNTEWRRHYNHSHRGRPISVVSILTTPQSSWKKNQNVRYEISDVRQSFKCKCVMSWLVLVWALIDLYYAYKYLHTEIYVPINECLIPLNHQENNCSCTRTYHEKNLHISSIS